MINIKILIYNNTKYIELVKGLFTAEHEERAKQADPYVAYSKEADSFMFTIAPEPVVLPPDNEIWYTSSDGNVVTPYTTDQFGANILSNTYENGKGIIKFDNIVTTIGGDAFRRCESLTTIIIPESITSIGAQAFYICRSLTSITIPESVTSIGERAFGRCYSLTSITCEVATPPTLGLYNGLSNVTAVYVPAESVDAYKTAANWNYYVNVIQSIL